MRAKDADQSLRSRRKRNRSSNESQSDFERGPRQRSRSAGQGAAARQAGLRYVTEGDPGIARRRAGRGFAYLSPRGAAIRDPDTLARIKRLAIPPAWTQVWICPDARGHIQATGRDARGRKQYRYHQKWRAQRDRSKYGELLDFARALPRIRRQVDRDLALRGLPRRKVLGAMVRLLESTLIRVGNEEYARTNNSYGLTTLLDRHARFVGARVTFRFRGKSGVQRLVTLEDPHLARVVKRCQEVPGQVLFQYFDEDGKRCRVASSDVNDYLREISGTEFTAKYFRTWGGTLEVMCRLASLETPASEREAKRQILEAIRYAAEHLGNTATVCRNFYVHPGVLEAYSEGWLSEVAKQRRALADRTRPAGTLSARERALASLLDRSSDLS